MSNPIAGLTVLVALPVLCLFSPGLVTRDYAQEPAAQKAAAQKAAAEKPRPNDDPFQDAIPAAPAVPAARLLPAMRAIPANPILATGLAYDLSNLVLAKIDEGPKGMQLLALVEQTRTEMKDVTFTRMQQEKRTRVILVGPEGDKKEIEQEYTVSVPVMETRQVPVQVPAGKKPTAFPLDSLRIYRLDGTKVNGTDARKLLEKMSPVFLLRGFTGDIKPTEGVYLQALNPNCLIILAEPEHP